MTTSNPPQKTFTRSFAYLAAILNRNTHTSRLLNFIMRNPLYKGVFVLGSGTAIAQLISIVTAPIITRLYTPSDMGVLAIYSSILAIIGIGATLRYELAYPLPSEDEDAINLFGLSLVLLSITTAGFALVLIFGKDFLFDIFDLGPIEQYVWFLLIGFFGMGLYTILNYWAIRQRDYERITYTKISQGAGGSVSKILFSIITSGPVGLIFGHIISQVAGITTLARAMWREERKKFKAISLSRMKNVAKTYRSFPTFNLPASIINTVALQLPPIALLAIFNSEVVGHYALANMLVVLPGSLVSGSMGQAYFGEASKMVREGSRELKSLYTRTLRHLSLIAIPLIGVPALFAPFIVPIIFGGAWIEAGWYIWPLAIMAVMSFIASPTSTLHIYGYNSWKLIFDIVRTLGVLSGFITCSILGANAFATLTQYSIIVAIMYLVLIRLNLSAISKYYRPYVNS